MHRGFSKRASGKLIKPYHLEEGEVALNLSILLSRGKENNNDYVSNGE